MSSEKPLLRDPDIQPSDDLLHNVLGDTVFSVYSELIHGVSIKFDLNPEWRFYKDGGAWLCKVVDKKKTVFWLSVWDQYFRVVFYFTEKTRSGISELAINDGLKQRLYTTKMIGKLIPMIFDMKDKQQLADLKEVIRYKKGLK